MPAREKGVQSCIRFDILPGITTSFRTVPFQGWNRQPRCCDSHRNPETETPWGVWWAAWPRWLSCSTESTRQIYRRWNITLPADDNGNWLPSVNRRYWNPDSGSSRYSQYARERGNWRNWRPWYGNYDAFQKIDFWNINEEGEYGRFSCFLSSSMTG